MGYHISLPIEPCFITFPQSSLVFGVGDTKTAGDESDTFHIKLFKVFSDLHIQINYNIFLCKSKSIFRITLDGIPKLNQVKLKFAR